MSQAVVVEGHEYIIDSRAGDRERQIVDTLTESGITVAASLPDDWVCPIIDLVDEHPDIDHIRVAREPEIVGVLGGAFLGGARAVGIMGATGFLTTIGELATLGLKFQLPMFLMVSLRGGPYDTQVFQEVQWRSARRLADALELPSITLDRPEKLEGLPKAYEALRIHKRPYIAWLTKSLLTGAVPMD
jgi:sulfopyruvate decarboxylase subunit alpha